MNEKKRKRVEKEEGEEGGEERKKGESVTASLSN